MIYLLAIVLGLAGSLHCILMCTPLQLWMFGKGSSVSNAGNLFIFHSSRALAYGIFGFIVGIAGMSLSLLISQKVLLIVLAALLFFGIVTKANKPLAKLISPLRSRLLSSFGPDKLSSRSRFALYGFSNALVPCGLIYTALLSSAGLADPLKSAYFMMAFALGTVPALIISKLGISQFSFRINDKAGYILFAVQLLAFSVLISKGYQFDESGLLASFFNFDGTQDVSICH